MVRPGAWVLEFWSEIPLPKPTPKRERTVYTEALEASLDRQKREFDICSGLANLLGVREGQKWTFRWEDVAWPPQAWPCLPSRSIAPAPFRIQWKPSRF